MAYRDDHEALRSYHEDLTRRLAALEGQAAELTAVEAERDRVSRELTRVSRDLEQHRARTAPIRLDNLRVASPCKEQWADMSGDDFVRDCARCEKQVFNISALTAVQAEELLAAKGAAMCVRFFRRADGTIMTSDCPVGARRKRRKLAIVAGAFAGAAGIAGTIASQVVTDEPEEMHETAGLLVVDPPQPHVEMLGDPAPQEMLGDIDPNPVEFRGQAIADPPPPHAAPPKHPKPHR